MTALKKILRVLHACVRVPQDAYTLLITYWPGPLGDRLRHFYWGKRLGQLAPTARIDVGVHFQNPEFIFIGENTWIDRYVLILAGPDQRTGREKVVRTNKAFTGTPGTVVIGSNVHIGPKCIISGISAGVVIGDNCGLSANVSVYSFSHMHRSDTRPADRSICFTPMVECGQQCILEGAITLGPNTGVALSGVILPGVNLPEDCFVAINSVVFPGSYEPNSVIAGNPAKQVSSRFRVPKGSSVAHGAGPQGMKSQAEQT
ncbi:MAG: hypothetical protein ACE14M_10750 [Terriglobales bacterium]